MENGGDGSQCDGFVLLRCQVTEVVGDDTSRGQHAKADRIADKHAIEKFSSHRLLSLF